MTAKERVLAILDRAEVDRIPVDLWHTDEVLEALKAHFGEEDELDLYKAMGVDKIVWCFAQYAPPGSAAMGSTHLGGERTAWGAPLRTMDTGTAVYQEFGAPPLAGYETPESLDAYPYWPDPQYFDYAAMTSIARRASDRFCVLGPWVSLYEVYTQMRGLENAMMDVAMNPALFEAILDRIESIQSEMMRRFFALAAPYVDLTFISDDMGSQDSLLLSTEVWDTHFKARMVRWCDLIHEYGVKVFYHSDGAVEPLIGRLIDAGIDVLNPIQHVCPGMDRQGLKRKYGGRVVFHGGVDNQSVLPFGSADDVRQETLECLHALGAGGEGYIACSCHNIQPQTPVENVAAMIQTVHEYGANL